MMGGWLFAAEPDRPFSNRPSSGQWRFCLRSCRFGLRCQLDSHVRLDLTELREGSLRQAPDGWYAVSADRCRDYVVELLLDRDVESRADAAGAFGGLSMAGPRERRCMGSLHSTASG